MYKITNLCCQLFFCCLATQTFASHLNRLEKNEVARPYSSQGQLAQINTRSFIAVDTGINNSLTEQENAEGWELLFDGKDPSIKWRSNKGNRFPRKGWTVEKGSLVLSSGNRGGDIITRQSFGNFELVLDYKLTDSANTGIKYLVSELKNLEGETVLNGPEFQLIDDFKHETVVGGKSPETSTGSLYLLYAPENKVQNGAGEWNQAKIIVRGNDVEHWLNGVKILSYKRGTEEFRKLVSQTKFSDYIDYGEATSGYILLQDHHDKVSFRNIKIRKIK